MQWRSASFARLKFSCPNAFSLGAPFGHFLRKLGPIAPRVLVLWRARNQMAERKREGEEEEEERPRARSRRGRGGGRDKIWPAGWLAGWAPSPLGY